jgi:DNA primase
VNPEDTGRQRIIIPYYYGGHLVGNTSRFYDNRAPKYLSEQQRGYVFNIDNQQADWTVCILVEGQFDAISIGGCAYLGSTISEQQAHILSKLRRTIIVVPDRDSAGLEVCDRALELGYRVSIPDWDSDIKDVNDAVKRYGRLTTTLSILEAATSSKIKIEMTRKKFK